MNYQKNWLASKTKRASRLALYFVNNLGGVVKINITIYNVYMPNKIICSIKNIPPNNN